MNDFSLDFVLSESKLTPFVETPPKGARPDLTRLTESVISAAGEHSCSKECDDTESSGETR